jgi:hypothetical protein
VSRYSAQVLRTLGALGGEATLGDLVAITGLPRSDIADTLDGMIADGTGHVRVCESGDVVYHLVSGPDARRSLGTSADPRSGATTGFDRKTVQLIRAREGVISLAELVEHTGLSLAGAQREMRRLAGSFGGVPHTSLDGHVVHAFPELMTSAHGRFGTREPRPAWVRSWDPSRPSRRGALGRLLHSLRFRHWPTVRRYLLGLVIETALAGKGVVSLRRAERYIRARAGAHSVSGRVVERALRGLAAEFDAPITEFDGDLFFGFRSVKRQFLASQLVRRRMRLQRMASGPTVFDTADSPRVAAARELEAFDRDLAEGRPAVAAG